jgi:hypothetical protein
VAKKKRKRITPAVRRRLNPPPLSDGEALLWLFLNFCDRERITASTPAAARNLEEIKLAARRIVQGDDPFEAFGLESTVGRSNDYWRDLDIALHIHSEKSLRGRKWKEVTDNVNRWLKEKAKTGPTGRPPVRANYVGNLSQRHLERIYREHRHLVEQWNALLPDLSSV